MPLREYLAVLRERWWAIVLAGALAALIGLAFAKMQTPVYRSSVRLKVGGRVDYAQVLAVEKVLRQVAAHVRTTPVAETVDRRLQLGLGPDPIMGRIRTQVFSDSLILQIDVDDDDPARAQRLAAAVGEAVQERQAEMMGAMPTDQRVTVAVLDRPSPAQFVWPQTRSIVAASALLGLLIGAALAFVLDYLDDTIRSDDDARRWLGLPVLGMIPVENR